MKTAQEVIDFLAEISDYRYLAMDEDGEWYAFVNKPLIGTNTWYGRFGLQLGNIQPATDWKQSLTEAKV